MCTAVLAAPGAGGRRGGREGGLREADRPQREEMEGWRRFWVRKGRESGGAHRGGPGAPGSRAREGERRERGCQRERRRG